MLLTKRITTLLQSSVSPSPPSPTAQSTSTTQPAPTNLHTLLLLTPSGKLLSSSSPSPTSLLRTQSTIACSLWGLYTSQSHPSPNPHPPSENNSNASASDLGSLVENALPQRQNGQGDSGAKERKADVKSVLVQLEFGIMVVRMLKCGLLFVAVGASPNSPHNETSEPQPSQDAQGEPDVAEGDTARSDARDANMLSVPAGPVGGDSKTSSENASLNTMTTGTGSGSGKAIMGVRKQAEEFGGWLDGRMEGFVLSR